MQNWQDFVALTIVTVAGLLLLYRFIQAGRGKGSPGCGCSSCAGCHSEEEISRNDNPDTTSDRRPLLTLDPGAFKDSSQKR